MKNKIQILLLTLLSLTFTYGCASSSPGTSGQKVEKGYDQYTTLAQALRSVAGVTVSGGDSNPNIILRGGGGGGIDNVQPLFVVDNVIVGTNYAQANALAPPSNIKTIRILNGAAATNRYGQEGRGGVIVITTKTASGGGE